MFKTAHIYSSYSIDDVEKARDFYGNVLGLDLSVIPGMEDSGMFDVHLAGGNRILLYQRPSHEPAAYTVLNIVVSNIDTAIDDLVNKGVQILRYEGFNQDDKGIMRGLSVNQGPDIAWFTDPAGNIISVQQETVSPAN